jgi:hypothetical protein
MDAGRDAGHDAGMDAFVVEAFPDAPLDAGTDAVLTDAGDPCFVDDLPLTGVICERALQAQDATLSCPGGFVDVVARGVGTLRWECDGRRAEAVFAAGVYRGTVSGDAFALCIRTEFDYVDGCRWQSSQRIEGDIDASRMSLRYDELAIVSDGDCFPPCTASAEIVVP